MFKSFFTIALSLSTLLSFGNTEIKTMFYNLQEFPEALAQNRQDIFMICELQSQEGADFTFSIYNTLGHKISETSNNNQTTTVINIAHLSEGIYYLTNNQSSSQTLKFLKTF